MQQGINVTELLAGKTAVFASKGEAKKMIQGGGVAINKQKIATAEDIYTKAIINEKFLVAQKGKKNYFLIIARIICKYDKSIVFLDKCRIKRNLLKNLLLMNLW